jgi:OOP family OmpA-OmpF porin
MNRPPQQTMPSSSAEPERTSASLGAPPLGSDEALLRLRKILLTSELDAIGDLRRRLDDPDVRAEEAAAILSEAVRRAAAADPKLAVALRPLVETGFQESIRQNPAPVVDTIYPILGLAIRKAVASAVRGMLESLNRVSEQSFTARGLRWRMEAWRTGQPIAEIALKHSVVYRVEQVLLIHRETGLLLQALGADPAAHDKDLVSGMLTAIQDFVHDSFSVERDQDLDRLEVGDFQVWIERGPRAVLAAVIRGSAPRRLRERLSDAVASVHRDMRIRLERFDGDPAPFEAVRPALEECLEEEFREKRKGVSPPLIVAATLLLALLGAWGYFAWRNMQRWSRFAEAVAAEPGLMLVERHGQRASLLRDPLAADPSTLAAAAGFDAGAPALEVRPFLSMDPVLVERRVLAALGPPASVRLSYEAGVVTVSGQAPAEWVARLRTVAPALPGVDRLADGGLAVERNPALDRAAAEAEALRVTFPETIVTPGWAQTPTVDALAAKLGTLLAQARAEGVPVAITVVGRADATGAPEQNQLLSEQRARELQQALAQRGLPAESFPLRGEVVAAGADRTAGVAIRLGEAAP